MHSPQMLAKVVQSRPCFFFFGTIVAEAPVNFAKSMRRMNLVYTFLMSLEIIDGTETLVFPTAILLVALERFLVAGDVFPARHV
jgi:hypothetical protein